MSLKEQVNAFIQSFKTLGPYLFFFDPKYREATEEYPDFVSSRLKTGASAVGRGFLKNDIRVCTGCGDCGQVCPANAIKMDGKVSEDGSTKVASFEIDFAKCVFCGICVEICPVESIVHTADYELASTSKENMKVVFTQRDIDYLSKQEKIRKKVKQIRSYEVRR